MRVGRRCALLIAITALCATSFEAPAHAADQNPPFIPAAADWLTTVNYYREMAGVAPVAEDTSMSPGAYNHSCYMLLNDIAHDEVPGAPGYTAAGDTAGNNGNVAVSSATSVTQRSFVELWMTGPFHAIGMLRPNLQRVGYGQCENASTVRWHSGATLDVLRGLGQRRTLSAPILFPGNGTVTNLTKFIAESPNPVQMCGWGTTGAGLPVIAMMPEGFSANPTASMTGPSGPDRDLRAQQAQHHRQCPEHLARRQRSSGHAAFAAHRRCLHRVGHHLRPLRQLELHGRPIGLRLGRRCRPAPCGRPHQWPQRMGADPAGTVRGLAHRERRDQAARRCDEADPVDRPPRPAHRRHCHQRQLHGRQPCRSGLPHRVELLEPDAGGVHLELRERRSRVERGDHATRQQRRRVRVLAGRRRHPHRRVGLLLGLSDRSLRRRRAGAGARHPFERPPGRRGGAGAAAAGSAARCHRGDAERHEHQPRRSRVRDGVPLRRHPAHLECEPGGG
ncbi:MAG: hypothetical protein IPL07_16930 [Acidimicrobiaceae bacterium]|nr:hypothetical protein [Acidimicrobiaceae bacterium]